MADVESRTRAFRHENDDEVEAEYDRLRDMAHVAGQKRRDCVERSKEAYAAGNGADAKELSNEAKRHASKMDQFNREASEYIFRANNAPGRVDEDEIDLHGQYPDEAVEILRQRVEVDQSRGAPHLHVIVGKGNHSVNNKRTVKPAVEEYLQSVGLRFETEEDNEGRIFVRFAGGAHYQPSHPHQPSDHEQPHHPHQPSHHGQPQQEEPDLSTTIFKAVEKYCCVVM